MGETPDVDAFLAHVGTKGPNGELMHVGVKGMKWGVRKSPSTSGGSSGGEGSSKSGSGSVKTGRLGKKAEPEPEASSSDHKTSRVNKGRSVASLSNKELQELNNRLNMEEQYAKLTAKPGKMDVVNKRVKKALEYGETYNKALSFVNSPAGSQIKDILNGLSGGKAKGAMDNAGAAAANQSNRYNSAKGVFAVGQKAFPSAQAKKAAESFAKNYKPNNVKGVRVKTQAETAAQNLKTKTAKTKYTKSRPVTNPTGNVKGVKTKTRDEVAADQAKKYVKTYATSRPVK